MARGSASHLGDSRVGGAAGTGAVVFVLRLLPNFFLVAVGFMLPVLMGRLPRRPRCGFLWRDQGPPIDQVVCPRSRVGGKARCGRIMSDEEKNELWIFKIVSFKSRKMYFESPVTDAHTHTPARTRMGPLCSRSVLRARHGSGGEPASDLSVAWF